MTGSFIEDRFYRSAFLCLWNMASRFLCALYFFKLLLLFSGFATIGITYLLHLLSIGISDSVALCSLLLKCMRACSMNCCKEAHNGPIAMPVWLKRKQFIFCCRVCKADNYHTEITVASFFNTKAEHTRIYYCMPYTTRISFFNVATNYLSCAGGLGFLNHWKCARLKH